MSPPTSRATALAVGLACLGAWAVTALFAAGPALQGWLIGFLFVSCLSLGALAAVLIHRLTGGEWGAAFAPELAPAARATPILCVFFLPVLIGLPLVYGWASASGLKPGVAGYLNVPFFAARSVAALVGWSAIALRLPTIVGPRGRLGAGLALVFHGVAVSVVAVDWVLSVLPSWTSSNFGMDLAVQQLAAAFAWAGLQGRRRTADAASGDISGLMLATLVGLTYLEFMSYLVVWYGDKPSLDAWYIPRASWPWQALCWISLACGAASVALLAGRRALGAQRAAALVGACMLAGLFSYQLWLLAPAFGAACLPPALLALLGQGGVWIALTGGAPRLASAREPRVHGR